MEAVHCRAIGHVRDGGSIRRAGATFTSVCLYCGTDLIRVAPKVWRELPAATTADCQAPASEAPAEAAPAQEPVEAIALRMAMMVRDQEVRRFGLESFADRDYFLDLYRRCLAAARGQEPANDAELLLVDRMAPSPEPLLLTHRLPA